MLHISEAIAIRLECLDRVGSIRIDNPPINAGSRMVRAGLLEAIRQVDADEGLWGILIGAGAIFMAGSDIREFDAPLEKPQVIHVIETSPKPILAVIAGAALRGGYELASRRPRIQSRTDSLLVDGVRLRGTNGLPTKGQLGLPRHRHERRSIDESSPLSAGMAVIARRIR